MKQIPRWSRPPIMYSQVEQYYAMRTRFLFWPAIARSPRADASLVAVEETGHPPVISRSPPFSQLPADLGWRRHPRWRAPHLPTFRNHALGKRYAVEADSSADICLEDGAARQTSVAGSRARSLGNTRGTNRDCKTASSRPARNVGIRREWPASPPGLRRGHRLSGVET
jgi:hypothetical protein